MMDQTFEQDVLARVTTPEGTYPITTYDSDGDCIEFIASNEPFYAERVDSLVTVYYGRDSGEIVGSLIKGVQKFLRDVVQRSPGFRIEVRDGRIKLEHIFTARLWSESVGPRDMPAIIYKKLRKVAKQTGAEVDVGECVFA